ncbi:UNVERIFIED_CONTAM: hypothetical protein HDU68_005743 [Siphonaria sp. JEL0065]|nr:hypothetical protein HDU68_005743 [Siphonaria sp. JEL0065]
MNQNQTIAIVGLTTAALLFGYSWKTAFTPSPKPTRLQVLANGGKVCFTSSTDPTKLLEYFEFGNSEGKKVLVAFHGAQTTGNLFPILHEWATQEDIRIIAPTLPGFGLTPHQSGFSNWVQDIVTLLQSLNVTRFHLLGTSLGFHPSPIWKNATKKRLLEHLLFIPLLKMISPRDSDTARSIRWQWEGVNSCADVIYFERADVSGLANGGRRRVVIVSGTEDAVAAPHNQTRLHDMIQKSEIVTYKGVHERAIVEPSLMIEHLKMVLV